MAIRKSSEQTTEKMFMAIHQLRETGMTFKQICNTLNVGETRVTAVLKFKTYQEFIDGRGDLYERWRKNESVKRKHQKAITPERYDYADDEMQNEGSKQLSALTTGQDLHDIAREMLNIRTLLQRLVEVWEK